MLVASVNFRSNQNIWNSVSANFDTIIVSLHLMVVTSKDRNIYIEISKKDLQCSVFTALFHSFREGRKEIESENISSK